MVFMMICRYRSRPVFRRRQLPSRQKRAAVIREACLKKMAEPHGRATHFKMRRSRLPADAILPDIGSWLNTDGLIDGG